MKWQTAGMIIFWVSLLATLGWAFLGYQLLSAAFLIGGIILAAEAFIAEKAVAAFPFKTHKTKLGLFSCTLKSHCTGLFDSVALKVDAKNLSAPFKLEVHARKIIWKAKEKAKKNQKEWSKIVGLVEADIDRKKATVMFEDEPNIRKSIADTLKLLEKSWR